MQVQLARWGNSLGIRIPKDIASQVGLRDGARVDIRAEGDRIVITVDRPRYSLDELMKGVTPEAMREAFDWGLANRLVSEGRALAEAYPAAGLAPPPSSAMSMGWMRSRPPVPRPSRPGSPAAT